MSQRRPVDPAIRLFYRLNSATTPSRTVAIQDARVHIDILNEGDKKWVKDTPAGVVMDDSVIGGGFMPPPSAAVLFIGGMARRDESRKGSFMPPPAASVLFIGGEECTCGKVGATMPPPAAAVLFLGGKPVEKHRAIVY